jgi:hypothetical protein
MSHITHLLLDFENVEPPAEEIERVRGPDLRLWVLHGPHQKKFTADRVKAWQPLGEQVQFIQSLKAGKNALDLHVAYCLGEVRQQEKTRERQAVFVVVSKDKDFDPLVEYVGSLGTPVARVNSISEALALAAIFLPRPAATAPVVENEKKPSLPKARLIRKSTPASANAELAIAHLRDHPKNRPTSRRKLEHYLQSNLGNKVDGKAVVKVIEELTSSGVLRFEGTKVNYTIPKRK